MLCSAESGSGARPPRLKPQSLPLSVPQFPHLSVGGWIRISYLEMRCPRKHSDKRILVKGPLPPSSWLWDLTQETRWGHWESERWCNLSKVPWLLHETLVSDPETRTPETSLSHCASMWAKRKEKKNTLKYSLFNRRKSTASRVENAAMNVSHTWTQSWAILLTACTWDISRQSGSRWPRSWLSPEPLEQSPFCWCDLFTCSAALGTA